MMSSRVILFPLPANHSGCAVPVTRLKVVQGRGHIENAGGLHVNSGLTPESVGALQVYCATPQTPVSGAAGMLMLPSHASRMVVRAVYWLTIACNHERACESSCKLSQWSAFAPSTVLVVTIGGGSVHGHLPPFP